MLNHSFIFVVCVTTIAIISMVCSLPSPREIADAVVHKFNSIVESKIFGDYEIYAEEDCDFERRPPTLPDTLHFDILIAIDGTSTEESYRSADNVIYQNNAWTTHVGNFWQDYNGHALYWFGPSNFAPANSGDETKGIIKGAVDNLCSILEEIDSNYTHKEMPLSIDNYVSVDVIGWSRGGYAAIAFSDMISELDDCSQLKLSDDPTFGRSKYSRKLKFPQIRFLGLYDPVRMINIVETHNDKQTLGNDKETFDRVYDSTVDSDNNILYITRAYASDDYRDRRKEDSRWWFYRCEEDSNSMSKNEKGKENFAASHSAIGGNPGHGGVTGVIGKAACDKLEDEAAMAQEKTESIKVDMFMREHAMKAGVPIKMRPESDYVFDEKILTEEQLALATCDKKKRCQGCWDRCTREDFGKDEL